MVASCLDYQRLYCGISISPASGLLGFTTTDELFLNSFAIVKHHNWVIRLSQSPGPIQEILVFFFV